MSTNKLSLLVFFIGDIFLISMCTILVFGIALFDHVIPPTIAFAITSCIYGVIIYALILILLRGLGIFINRPIPYSNILASLFLITVSILLGALDLAHPESVLPELGLGITGGIFLIADIRHRIIVGMDVQGVVARVHKDIYNTSE